MFSYEMSVLYRYFKQITSSGSVMYDQAANYEQPDTIHVLGKFRPPCSPGFLYDIQLFLRAVVCIICLSCIEVLAKCFMVSGIYDYIHTVYSLHISTLSCAIQLSLCILMYNSLLFSI